MSAAACSGGSDGDDRPAATTIGTQGEARRGGTLRINLTEDTDYTDPGLAYYTVSWQMLALTCVKLLNYPVAALPQGSQVVPEAAAAMPTVSADGLTYTFIVPPGRFKFSPPSGEPVTAATFKHVIERVIDLKQASPGASFLGDVKNVAVSGDTLTIELAKPAPDFLARIAMPFSCAVPLATPINPNGELLVPAAGAYYVTKRIPKRSIVLERNPNYTGDRPANPDRIEYTVGVDPNQGLLQVKRGQADFQADVVPPSAHGGLHDEWGPGSENAKAGKQRYFVDPLLSFLYYALNTTRPPFDDPNVRKAVSFAIDRPALIRQSGKFAGQVTDQHLPPGLAGFRDEEIYPLDGPDVERARELMGGKRAKVVLYTCNTAPCPQEAQIIQQNLEAIGLDVEIKQFDFIVGLQKAGTKGEPFDMVFAGWAADYPDPYDFINVLLYGGNIGPKNNQNFSYFDDPEFNRRMEEAALLPGKARLEAYGSLDVDIARDAAPLAVVSNANSRTFFSERVGCQVYTVYLTDLGALCIE